MEFSRGQLKMILDWYKMAIGNVSPLLLCKKDNSLAKQIEQVINSPSQPVSTKVLNTNNRVTNDGGKHD